MKYLAKVGVILLIASIASLSSQISSARDFNLEFNGSSKISTVESNAVVRGDRDRYYFNAKEGQRISIAVTSFEDNAVLELSYRKGNQWIAIPNAKEGEDARVYYGTLPEAESNQYRITIGGTRGNATYDLFVGISNVASFMGRYF